MSLLEIAAEPAAGETGTPELEALIGRGEELLRAVRFVGDEEDLYFWRIRRADWACSVFEHGAETALPFLAAGEAGLSLTEELSRDVDAINAALAQLNRRIDDAVSRMRPAAEAGC